MKEKRKRPREGFWCGFTDGRPHVEYATDAYDLPGRYIALFTNRRAALARFKDVRLVRLEILREP